MKITICIISILILCVSGNTENFIQNLNIQLHYDIPRDHPTATLEYFGTDKLGNWFFFIDFNFNHTILPGLGGKQGGLSDVYLEIMRYFKILDIGPRDLNITVQYNDGSEPVKQIWLAGLNLSNIQLTNFNLSTEFLFKKEYKFNINWQYTLVWYAEFFRGKLIFNGFLDYWINDTDHNEWPSFDPEFAATRYSFQAEPQLGWMLTPRWKIGTEVEIDRGFLGTITGKLALTENYQHDKWYFLPTLFIQYNF
jgi:hypothetical protein